MHLVDTANAGRAMISAMFSERASILLLWTVMAATNLIAGAVISSWPERQEDFRTVAEWARLWLRGTDIYGLGGEFADYPPHAIVLFSPLGMVAPGIGIWLWTGINLALAAAAVYLTVRSLRPAAPAGVVLLPMLMFLTWGGFRTLLQFSLLSLTLGLASMVLADRKPRWSGVLLGLSLIKPQIAFPFVLWMCFSRRWRHLVTAAAVVAIGSGLYCARAGVSPVRVVLEYAGILREMYSGDATMHGLAQLRPILVATAAPPAAVDAIATGIALAMLAGICLLGVLERGRPMADRYAAPGLAAVWSLLTFYHLTYGFLLLLPVAASLLFSDNAQTRAARRRMFWFLQIVLMVDVATVWRWTAPVDASPTLEVLVFHVDRVLALSLFVALTWLTWRSRARPQTETARR